MNSSAATHPSPEPAEPLSGLLLIDKPADRRITSMTVCRSVRRRLFAGGERGSKNIPRSIKVGHAGTLDPLASGLMIVMVGRATKLCSAMMDGAKTYVAEFDCSRSSNTDDLEGEIELNPPSDDPGEAAVRAALTGFTGLIQQRPPAFSAMWINGERAYALARAGASPEMKLRPVRIDAIDLLAINWPRLTLRIDCGKGTYIRSLARDLGLALTGHAGCLAALRRTRVGEYSVDNATPLNSLPDAMTRADLLPAPDASHPPSPDKASPIPPCASQ